MEANMKKIIVGMALLVSVGLIVSHAWAYRGNWGGPMKGHSGGYYSNVNHRAAYQNFLNDTANLRRKLAGKQAEYDTLMAQPNPDSRQTDQLAQEIAEIQNQLQAKANGHRLSMPYHHDSYYYEPMSSGGHRGYCW